jgi:hypothetical protein
LELSVRRRSLALLVLALVFALLVPGAAFAEQGAGTGGGTGGGGGPSVPLGISDSYPADGATDVSPATRTLWVKFAHNVADPVVACINIPLVALSEADGTPVTATTWVFDPNLSQDAFERRQYVYLDVSSLEPGTTYVITAGAGMRSRNLLTSPCGIMSEAEYVTFTTAADVSLAKASAEATLSAVEVPAEAIITDKTISAGGGFAAVATDPTLAEEAANSDVTTLTATSAITPTSGADGPGVGGGLTTMLVMGAVVVLVALGGVLVFVRRARLESAVPADRDNNAEGVH